MPERHRNHHGDIKRREAAFEHLRAELLREGSNRNSFRTAKQRVMARPEVQRDPALRAMLEQVVAEREAYFKQLPEHLAPHSLTDHRTPSSHLIHTGPDPASEARDTLKLLETQFREAVSHFHVVDARGALERMRAVWGRHPALKPDEQPARAQDELDRLLHRRNAFLKHVDEWSDKAVHAAGRGHEDHAARALTRLSSIHALHPDLLTDARFDEIRRRIEAAGDRREDQVLARKLLMRERAVAEEIKGLARVIHQFQKTAKADPHDGAEFAKAEAAYHEAVRALSAHDSDWLAGVILELVDLLGEFHSADTGPQEQVDRFVNSVRSALSHLRKEVRDGSAPTE